MKKLKLILIFILTILSVLILPGCVKYRVVQELDTNMYHLYNEKEGAVVVITPDKLEINKFYKLKNINKINER
tara:strand:+ start:782 stop:1000 length:219 start_codon:yes stop_codon:yes gene_type:complete